MYLFNAIPETFLSIHESMQAAAVEDIVGAMFSAFVILILVAMLAYIEIGLEKKPEKD